MHELFQKVIKERDLLITNLKKDIAAYKNKAFFSKLAQDKVDSNFLHKPEALKQPSYDPRIELGGGILQTLDPLGSQQHSYVDERDKWLVKSNMGREFE